MFILYSFERKILSFVVVCMVISGVVRYIKAQIVNISLYNKGSFSHNNIKKIIEKSMMNFQSNDI